MRRARRIPPAAGLLLEGALLAGGLRAILLQLAHPAVGHGVAGHSDFARDPLKRLHGTLEYVYVVTHGDEALTRWVARRVGALHRPVVSAADAPVGYDARDTHLQWYVAATLHDTAFRIATAVWGPLPAPLAEELLAEHAVLATALGMPAGEWPATRAEFTRRFEADLAATAFDATTAAVVRELIAARATPLWIRLGMRPFAALTASTLPAHLADQLQLVPGRRGALRVAAGAYRLLPARLRRTPARRYLAAARRAAGD